MNNEVVSQYNEYLKLTGGDKAAAASLTLAAVMVDDRAQAQQPVAALTVDEAASRLRTHRKTVYRLCRRGALRCYRAGRVIRISLEEIERFESESRAKPEAPRFPDIIKRHY